MISMRHFQGVREGSSQGRDGEEEQEGELLQGLEGSPAPHPGGAEETCLRPEDGEQEPGLQVENTWSS